LHRHGTLTTYVGKASGLLTSEIIAKDRETYN
jgi:hypothetical protein